MSGAAIARYIVLGALFLIPFIPLYVADGLFFPFITGKGFVFRILVEVAALGWLWLALSDVRYRPQRSWLLILYGLLVLWMFVADMFAINPHKAFWSNYERMDGWITMIHVFILFVVAGSVLSVSNLWRRWWLTFLSGAALVCGYGLLQILHVFQTHQGARIDATFGNAAYLPAYLLFGIGVALWQGVLSRGWLRYTLFLLAGIEVFILLFTATRGALFGLVGAVVVGALVWGWTAGKKGRGLAAGVLLALVVVSGMFFAAKDSAVVMNSPTLSRLSSVFSLSEELQTRFTIWGTAARGFADRPLIGYGHEGFNYVFNTYYEPSLFTQEQWFDRAHSTFIDWAMAGGAPALLLFLALLGYATLALMRKEFTRVERVFLLSVLVAYVIQGLVVFDNLFTYVPLALVLAYIHVRIAKPLTLLEQKPVLGDMGRMSAGTILMVAGAVVVWQVNMPGLLGAAKIIDALQPTTPPEEAIGVLQQAVATGSFGAQEIREQMVAYAAKVLASPNVPDATRAQVYSLAVEEVGKEVERVPQDPRLRLQYASLYRSGGNTEAALAQIDAAVALSPKKQTTYLERGTTLWQAERFGEARDAFYTAYNLDTSFPQLAAYAAAGDIVAGEREKGEALLAQYYDASLQNVPNIIFAAYQQIGDFDAIIEVFKARVATADTLETRLQLASMYAELGRIAEARTLIQETIARYPDIATAGAEWLRQLEETP